MLAVMLDVVSTFPPPQGFMTHAYAVSGPDLTFDRTKESLMVLLTDKPLAAGAIKEADSFSEVHGKSASSLVQSGLTVIDHRP